MTVFYREGGTSPRSLDYAFGISQCVMLIVSSLLNPIVFLYHFKNRKKSTSLLISMLAFSDFFSLLFGVPYAIYNFFRDGHDIITAPDGAVFTITILQLLFYRLSLFITALMSIQRLIAVQVPRYIVRARLIYVTLLLWFVHLAASMFMYMEDTGITPIVPNVTKFELPDTKDHYCVWDPMVQSISCPVGWDDVINNFIINLFGWALINLVASIWTIIKLISRGTALHSIAEKKSIVTIVLLSISASFMYAPAPIGALLLSNYDLYNPTEVKEGVYDRKVEYEITWFLIISYFPQITSVLNPVILMIRGSQLQEFVRGNLSAKLKNRQNWTQSTFLNKSARVEVTDNHVKENIQMTDVVKTCTIANLQCNVKNFSV